MEKNCCNSKSVNDPSTYFAQGGVQTIGRKHWKYSDSKTTTALGSVTTYRDLLASDINTCGGWTTFTSINVNPATGLIASFGNPNQTNSHGMWPMYVKDWWKSINRRRRYMFVAESYEGGFGLGEQGSKYLPTNEPTLEPHFNSSGELKTSTLPSTPAPGIRSDGVYSGYNSVPFGAGS